jgi:multidrug efflux pump subunit AcrB
MFQFRNIVKPLIVFSALPFDCIGAFAALYVTGRPFGFMAFLGIASLMGVIVSHIIVLFESIEEHREQGEDLMQALVNAAVLRLRPVLITVGATRSFGTPRRAALGAAVLRADRRAAPLRNRDAAARSYDLRICSP